VKLADVFNPAAGAWLGLEARKTLQGLDLEARRRQGLSLEARETLQGLGLEARRRQGLGLEARETLQGLGLEARKTLQGLGPCAASCQPLTSAVSWCLPCKHLISKSC